MWRNTAVIPEDDHEDDVEEKKTSDSEDDDIPVQQSQKENIEQRITSKFTEMTITELEDQIIGRNKFMKGKIFKTLPKEKQDATLKLIAEYETEIENRTATDELAKILDAMSLEEKRDYQKAHNIPATGITPLNTKESLELMQKDNDQRKKRQDEKRKMEIQKHLRK